MQQADRHRLCAQFPAAVGQGQDIGVVKRPQHAAVGGDAFVDLQHPARRHRSLRFAPGIEIGGAWNVLTPDLQHMAESARRHQDGVRSLTFQDQVRRHRRTVEHPPDSTRLRARGVQHHAHADQERLGRVVRRAGGLGAQHKGSRRVRKRDVGERAANIDGNDQAFRR